MQRINQELFDHDVKCFLGQTGMNNNSNINYITEDTYDPNTHGVVKYLNHMSGILALDNNSNSFNILLKKLKVVKIINKLHQHNSHVIIKFRLNNKKQVDMINNIHKKTITECYNKSLAAACCLYSKKTLARHKNNGTLLSEYINTNKYLIDSSYELENGLPVISVRFSKSEILNWGFYGSMTTKYRYMTPCLTELTVDSICSILINLNMIHVSNLWYIDYSNCSICFHEFAPKYTTILGALPSAKFIKQLDKDVESN